MARKQIVILGGGTGGTIVANRLRRRFDADEARDPRRRPRRPPRLPAGSPVRAVRPRRRRTRSSGRAAASSADGIEFHESEVERVSLDATSACPSPTEPCFPTTCSWSRPASPSSPRRPRGCSGAGWLESVFTFYDLEGAAALRRALDAVRRRSSGREPRRHADQVPGRSARVRLPRRLAPARARRARRRRARYATPLDGALHEARRVRAARRPARARRRSSSRPSSTPARSTAGAACSSATTAARSRSTCS